MHLHSCLVTHLQRSTGSGSLCLDSYAALPPCYSQNYRAPHLYLCVGVSFLPHTSFTRLTSIRALARNYRSGRQASQIRSTCYTHAGRKSRDGRSVSFVLPKKVWTGRNALTVCTCTSGASIQSPHVQPIINSLINNLVGKRYKRHNLFHNDEVWLLPA